MDHRSRPSRLGTLLSTLEAGLLGLIAPLRCASCGHGDAAWEPFCDACARELQPCNAEDPRVRAPFWLEGGLRRAVHALKYEGRSDLGGRLGALLAAEVAAGLPAHDLVVPVPLTPARLRSRGYNQTALLAGPLARRTGRPLATDVLARRRFAGSQTKLGRAARAANVAEVFLARTGTPKRVVLVDDVVTTGATLAAAERALRQVGAEVVACLALCRAP